MSILEELKEPAVWEAFLQYKIERKHLSPKEVEIWQGFIEERAYEPVTEHLMEAGYMFDYPTKICVNKSGTRKKRVVYSFSETESMVLKAMGYLLYCYDEKISSRCYSFRRNITAKDAVLDVLRIHRLTDKYCLKVDISNYFNSIPTESLIEVLEGCITEDAPLLDFLKRLLRVGRAYEKGNLIQEERGAMAGIPIAPFFANIYLLSMDEVFEKRGVDYFRYSDDILLFADSEEELQEQEAFLRQCIEEKGLSINPDKVCVTKPGEVWEFLGFSYKQGKIDLSEITKNKLKAKIKRKAHALYRWRLKKGADFEGTARAMLRTFNKKLYDEAEENRFTWSRWFFPVLTTDEGLKELDAYLVQYIRYLYSGRHYKGNYRVTYDEIKALGFRSLVHEYYKGKEAQV
ncbi:MAG: group II intron reverse transcriptase domain-containing protein [Lachnospiraceae bacterium]|nr:group II intron reverse transcriptase domain-containing protein [Lachnospiraceae bacterium]